MLVMWPIFVGQAAHIFLPQTRTRSRVCPQIPKQGKATRWASSSSMTWLKG
jgi:hypothetical protein